MTSEIESGQPPAPAAPERKGSLRRMVGALFAPDETFRDIATRPDVLVPMIVLVILTIISSAVVVPRMDVAGAIRDQMESSNRNMSPEDIDRSVRFMSAFSRAAGYVAPLISICFWALIAGILLLAFRMFGSLGTYKQAFSATLYAWIPLTLNSIIATIVIAAKGSVDPREMPTVVRSNPAFLVDFKEHPVAFSFLSSLDLFTIWTVVLLIIGFAFVSRTSKARSAVTIISLWAFALAIKIGFAALGAARMKAAS